MATASKAQRASSIDSSSENKKQSQTRLQVQRRNCRPFAVEENSFPTQILPRKERERNSGRQTTRGRQNPQRRTRRRLPSTAVIFSIGIFIVSLLIVALLVLAQVWASHSNSALGRWPPSLHWRISSTPRSFAASYSLADRVQRAKIRRPNATRAPIIIVGLPKAGTSSLFHFFRCVGFEWTQHWYCCGKQLHPQAPPKLHLGMERETSVVYMSDCLRYNLHLGLPLLEGCGDYDVYTEINGPMRDLSQTENYTVGGRHRIFLPQYFNLPELHQAAPSAAWILNVRPVADWINSVQAVPAQHLTRQFVHEIKHLTNLSINTSPIEDSTTKHAGTQTLIRKSSKHSIQTKLLEIFWYDHIERIKDFVRRYPSHKLIIVNITNPNAGYDLANDLGWFSPVLSSEATQSLSPGKTRSCWGVHNVRQHGD